MAKSVIVRGTWLVLAALLAVADTGCTSWEAIPASRLPPVLLAKPRADLEQINFIRLRQDPPPVYQLGPRDILGIYIEGVLGQSDQPPPVHFPEKESNTPPAIGFPIPVREDGTVSLPLIPPIRVAGLTLTQAEDEIRRTYLDKNILPPGRERIVVTMIRPRTYQVLVVREDATFESTASTSSGGVGASKRGQAKAVDLKAYENDVLHALSQSGGLPGLDAKNEIKILRGAFADARGRAALLNDMDNGAPGGVSPDNPNVVTIPLRLRPSDPPSKYTEEDIILTNGDIVFIETREREVFYTGGLLQGKEMLLPRDYDLDVMGAVAVAGGNVSGGAGTGSNIGGMGGGGGGGGGFSNARGLIPATQVIIVRKVDGGYQIPIRVDLRRAQTNPAERILIKPGDLVLLQYTPAELITNIALNNIQLNYFLNSL